MKVNIEQSFDRDVNKVRAKKILRELQNIISLKEMLNFKF